MMVLNHKGSTVYDHSVQLEFQPTAQKQAVQQLPCSGRDDVEAEANAFVNVFGQTINKLFQFEKFFQLIGVISYVGSINPTLKWQLQSKSKIGKGFKMTKS